MSHAVLTLQSCVGSFVAASSAGLLPAVLVSMEGCPHCPAVRDTLLKRGHAVLEVVAGPGREEDVALLASALMLPSMCGNTTGALGRRLLAVESVPTTLFLDTCLNITSAVEGRL